jgi:integrase
MIKSTHIRDLRFLDLRHEAISRLFEKGLNPMEVAAISGHQTLQGLKAYTHIKVSHLADKLKKINL